MKFTLHRDPGNKLQKIPYPAMQVSGLADAEELVLYADEGCILLSRNTLPTRQALKTVSHLNEVMDSLLFQLVEASHDVMEDLDDLPDPLDEFDEAAETLVNMGADLDGLRMLLAMDQAQSSGSALGSMALE